MSREVISTPLAPAAIGPYSQAIKANGFLFVSGCIPLIPETMEMLEGDAAAQARRCLDNMGAILKAGGSDFDQVVKTTVLLADMADFASVNAVYSEYFPSNPPARACFAVKTLPKNSLVEIEAVALAQ